jgi:hypothetical protein
MNSDPYITIVWNLSLGVNEGELSCKHESSDNENRCYKLLLLYSDNGKVIESWWSDSKKYSELVCFKSKNVNINRMDFGVRLRIGDNVLYLM